MNVEVEKQELVEWWKRFSGIPRTKTEDNGLGIFAKEFQTKIWRENPSLTRFELNRQVNIRFFDLPDHEKSKYASRAFEMNKDFRRLQREFDNLIYAGKNGDIDTLRMLIAAERSRKLKPKKTVSVAAMFHYAVAEDGFIEAGQHPRAEYLVSSLYGAAKMGHIEICRLLLEETDVGKLWKKGSKKLRENEAYYEVSMSPEFYPPGGHPVVAAAENGHSEIVKVLLSHSDLIQDYWIWWDEQRQRGRYSRWRLWRRAVPMLEQGAGPKDFGMLLEEAAFDSTGKGNLHLDILLTNAYVDSILKCWTKQNPTDKDAAGNTILHLACKTPGLPGEAIKKIMEHNPGAVDALDLEEGLFPIHHACMSGLDLDSVFALGQQKPDTLVRFRVLLGPKSAVDSPCDKDLVTKKNENGETRPQKKQKTSHSPKKE